MDDYADVRGDGEGGSWDSTSPSPRGTITYHAANDLYEPSHSVRSSMPDYDGVRGDGEGGNRNSASPSPLMTTTFQAAMDLYYDDQLHESDHEEYQDTDKLYTNLIEENHITMEQTQDTNIYAYPTPNDELYCLNDNENSYTGMNKEETRKAASARYRCILHIAAYFIAKVIVLYKDLLVVCYNSVTLTDRLNNHFDIVVGPAEPASELYIDISLVKEVTLCDIWTLQKEEEVHRLLVYWYFLIMNVIKYCECWFDKRKYDNMVLVFGYCVTPLLREIIGKIYKDHRKDKTETFEKFIKRIMPTKSRKGYDYLFPHEKDKIRISQHENFDISLMNKLIEAFVNFYINPTVPPSVSIFYNELHLKCKEITSLRNGKFHNLPEVDKAICDDYYVNFDRITLFVDYLETNLKTQFISTHIDRKYMKLNSLSCIPLSTNDCVAISLYIFLPLYSIKYLSS